MEPSPQERHVRLFRNGRNQAIEFEGKEENRLIIEEPKKVGPIELLDSLEPLDDNISELDSDLLTLDNIEL